MIEMVLAMRSGFWMCFLSREMVFDVLFVEKMVPEGLVVKRNCRVQLVRWSEVK